MSDLDEFEESGVGIDVTTLDEFVDKVPAIIGRLEEQLAKAWLVEEVLERQLKTINSRTWLSYKKVLRNGKAYSEKEVQHLTDSDPKVISAHLKYAKASAKRRHIEGQIRKWKSVDQKIPGMQGKQNQMTNSYNR